MRLYWEVLRRGFRRYSTYRAATLAGLFTNTVFGFLKAYILLAVYEQRDVVGGFDATDAVTFSFVTQGFFVMLGAGHLELAERIQSGDVVTDLYRPVDLQAWWLAQDLGRIAFQVALRGCVPFLVGSLVFDLDITSDPALIAAFAVSALLGIVVSFGHRFLVTLTTFWLLDYRGTSQVATVVTMFFSGMILPIGFFPDWLEALARALPYAAMLQLPVEVLLGKHTGSDLLALLGVQVLWAVLLLAGGRVLLSAASRKLVIQGG